MATRVIFFIIVILVAMSGRVKRDEHALPIAAMSYVYDAVNR